MSLQICSCCGWSKVTTYQGLRIHQGKKGCTPKGISIPQSQQYTYLPKIPLFQSPVHLEDPFVNISKTPLTSEREETNWINLWEESPQKDNMPILTPSVKEEVELTPPSQNFTPQMNPPTVQSPVTDSNRSLFETPSLKAHRPLDFSTLSVKNIHLDENFRSSDFIFGAQQTGLTPRSVQRNPGYELNTPFLQTPLFHQNLQTSSEKARRKLDFSTGELKAQRDEARADLQQRIHLKEQKMAEVSSSVKSCQDGLDAEWMHINNVFSEVIRVVEDARQKALDPVEERRQRVKREAENLLHELQKGIYRLKDSMDELDQNFDSQVSSAPDLEDWKNVHIDTSFSFGTLRDTTSTMMKEIQQKLENLSSLELKRIPAFAVEVKLDSATAHQCLVLSDDRKTVRDGGLKPKLPDSPERFDMFGSVLGTNIMTSGRSYWEVEVGNKTGWDLGVARRGANRKGILSVNSDNGFWVTVHYENKKYAALTVPPVSLSLKQKPQKVGVFLDYEEGLVSFYDVTTRSHIYSFTECSFRDQIVPYFSPHLTVNNKNTDPLVISAVHQL